MMRFLLYALGFYFLFKLIFEIVLPLYRTTGQIRRQFRDMQEKMNEQMEQPHVHRAPREESRPGKAGKGDYLDFEEIKKP